MDRHFIALRCTACSYGRVIGTSIATLAECPDRGRRMQEDEV